MHTNNRTIKTEHNISFLQIPHLQYITNTHYQQGTLANNVLQADLDLDHAFLQLHFDTDFKMIG